MGEFPQIRVGIIGQGRSGRNIHGSYLLCDDRYRIAAVAETIESRRQLAEEEYGCPVYADYRDMLARGGLDIVVNATYSYTNPGITIDCLNAGFNVVCEKPMAATIEKADEIIQAATRSGRLLTIYQQSRFAPALQQIVTVLNSGVLGRIVQISFASNGFMRRWDWQTTQAYGGGNLMNTGAHILDQALHLFGDGMPHVTCFMDRANTAGDAEDYAKIILSAPGRAVIDIELSSCCAYPSFAFNIQGTCGGLSGSTTDLTWKYFNPDEVPPLHLDLTPLAKPDGTPCYCSETLPWKTQAWKFNPATPAAAAATDLPPRPGAKSRPKASSPLFATMASAYYNSLYATLTTGAPLAITPEQVRRQMAVFELCRQQNPHIYKQHGKG